MSLQSIWLAIAERWTAHFLLVAGVIGVVPGLRSGLRASGIILVSSILATWLVSICPNVWAETNNVIRGSGADLVSDIMRLLFAMVSVSLPLFVAVEGVRSFGRLVDYLSGALVGEQLSPISGERQSTFEQVVSLLCMVLFLDAGGALPVLSRIVTASAALHLGPGTGVEMSLTELLGTSLASFRDYIALLLELVFPFALLVLLFDLLAVFALRSLCRVNLGLSEMNCLKMVFVVVAFGYRAWSGFEGDREVLSVWGSKLR